MVNSKVSLESKDSDRVIKSLLENFESGLTNGLENYHFEHNALPEINFSEINTSVKFLGRELSYPLLVYSMIENSAQTIKINRGLSELAGDYKLGFVVSDQKNDIKNKKTPKSGIRKIAPHMLLFANLSAVDLNYGLGLDECMQAIEMIDADALMLYIDPMHEAFQPDGRRNFSGLLKKIEHVCSKLEAPVVVKEVGYGISASVAKKLYDAGVYAVDVAGAGSMTWLEIEKKSSKDIVVRDVAETFSHWGNPTAECIVEIAEKVKKLKIISSGGVKNGIDIAKSIALGASLCGNASNFFKKSLISRAECENFVESIALELKIAMFCLGCKNIQDLRSVKLIKKG